MKKHQIITISLTYNYSNTELIEELLAVFGDNNETLLIYTVEDNSWFGPGVKYDRDYALEYVKSIWERIKDIAVYGENLSITSFVQLESLFKEVWNWYLCTDEKSLQNEKIQPILPAQPVKTTILDFLKFKLASQEVKLRLKNGQIQKDGEILNDTSQEIYNPTPLEEWIIQNVLSRSDSEKIMFAMKLWGVDNLIGTNNLLLQEVFNKMTIIKISKKEYFIAENVKQQ